MNYEKIYRDFMVDRKLRPLIKESGYEMHHIIPVSFGGGNEKTNMVKLTYREHFLAHKLLTFIYKKGCKDKYMKSVYSLWIICNSKPEVRNSREYENVKQLFRKITVPELRLKRGHPEDVFRTYHKKSATTNTLQMFLASSKGGIYGKSLYKRYFVKRVTPERLKPFLEFCAVVYKMGFNKISLSHDMEGFYSRTIGILQREVNHCGSSYTFTEDFKLACDGLDANPSFSVMERVMVKGKPIAGTRAAISEWNSKHPTKLIFAESEGNRVRFCPLNNWDTFDQPFMMEPLDYLQIREFREHIKNCITNKNLSK